MKTNTVILALAMCAVTQAMAADPSVTTSSSAKSAATGASLNAATVQAPKAKWQFANPFAPVKAVEKVRIYRVGNISSRPWTQIVGWHPGVPSSFTDRITHGSGLPLLWFGAEPQR